MPQHVWGEKRGRKKLKKTEKIGLTKKMLRDIIIELTQKNALASEKRSKKYFKKVVDKVIL